MPRIARLLTIGALAAVLTAAVGALAAWRANTEPQLTFVVFAATTAPVAFMAAWLILAIDDNSAPTHPDDTVESIWLQRASAGAFTDLLLAMGLALAVQNILAAPPVPLVVFVALAMADVALRYGLLRRREG